MLEILAIWYLVVRIGKIVDQKGYKRGWYIVMTIALWFGGEIFGAIVGMLVIGALGSEQCLIYLFALGGALIGAGIAYLIANSLPVAPDQILQPTTEAPSADQIPQEPQKPQTDDIGVTQVSSEIYTAQPPKNEWRQDLQVETTDQISGLKWYGAGIVLSCFSPTFYYHAVRRGLASALGFFFLFALAITGLQTLEIVINTAPIRREVNRAFISGNVPEITISRGEATIHGPEPFVVIDDDLSLVVLDTTGTYSIEDLVLGEYSAGFLLTKSTLVVFNREEGQFDQLELSDFNAIFGDPFEFNAQLVQRWFTGIQIIIVIGIALWNAIVRLIYIIMIGLLLWGITALLQRDHGFRPVLIVGLYALVPALYADYLLGRLGIDFFGMYTIILLVIWGVGLVAALAERREGFLYEERPLRAWRALIGVPMVLILALDSVINWETGALIIWIVVLLTFVAIWITR